MAKRISFDDRLKFARLEIQTAELSAITKGQKLEIIGMKRILRVFEGESDETIKALGKIGNEQLKLDGGGS